MTHSKESISKLLFGNTYRVTVWGAVAQRAVVPPEVFVRDDIEQDVHAGEKNAASVSTVFGELKLLEQLNMIERGDALPDRRVSFRRIEHPLWPVVEAATLAIDQLLGQQEA